MFMNPFYRNSKTQGRITEELALVCRELWSGRYKSISPEHFRYVFGQYERMFSKYDQQDSHEFLTILIDHLHSELQTPIGEVNLVFCCLLPLISYIYE